MNQIELKGPPVCGPGWNVVLSATVVQGGCYFLCFERPLPSAGATRQAQMGASVMVRLSANQRSFGENLLKQFLWDEGQPLRVEQQVVLTAGERLELTVRNPLAIDVPIRAFLRQRGDSGAALAAPIAHAEFKLTVQSWAGAILFEPEQTDEILPVGAFQRFTAKVNETGGYHLRVPKALRDAVHVWIRRNDETVQLYAGTPPIGWEPGKGLAMEAGAADVRLRRGDTVHLLARNITTAAVRFAAILFPDPHVGDRVRARENGQKEDGPRFDEYGCALVRPWLEHPDVCALVDAQRLAIAALQSRAASWPDTAHQVARELQAAIDVWEKKKP